MPRLREILPGLHRWTAEVADWTPEQGGPDGWQKAVSSVAFEGSEALVLVDPLVDGDDWGEIDALVERSGAPIAIVVTCPWHSRSAGAALRRYVNSPGATTHAHQRTVADTERIRFEVTHPFSGEAELPGGVSAIATDAPQGEVTLYIERIATVIAGDVLIGAEGERTRALRVCPQPWLNPANTVENVKAALSPLLEREIEAIVPLHGAPVLKDARKALEKALRPA